MHPTTLHHALTKENINCFYSQPLTHSCFLSTYTSFILTHDLYYCYLKQFICILFYSPLHFLTFFDFHNTPNTPEKGTSYHHITITSHDHTHFLHFHFKQKGPTHTSLRLNTYPLSFYSLMDIFHDYQTNKRPYANLLRNFTTPFP